MILATTAASSLPCFFYRSILLYSCDQSWIFSIITPVFSVTWSFRSHV